MKAYLKGLLMGLIGLLAATITDLETFNTGYVLISSIAFILLYLGKNAWLPSISESMSVDVQDLISGGLVAISMAISSFSASVLTTGNVDWKALLVSVISATVGYFGKTLVNSGK